MEVLKGVDFEVEKGEVVAITGASGAGKTTLLEILGTLSSPNSGSLIIDGTDVLALGSKALPAFRGKRDNPGPHCRHARGRGQENGKRTAGTGGPEGSAKPQAG